MAGKRGSRVDTMQHFTINFGRAWWSRLVGHNPLVRGSDRVAAWVSIAATVVIAVTAPIAGAIATSVHDSRTQDYVEQAQHSHQVTATALENGRTTLGPGPAEVTFVVRAGWRFAGRDHSGVVDWPDHAKTGDKQEIWVDDQGHQVRQPPSPGRADSEAVALGLTLWFAVMVVTVGIVVLVLLRVDRHRDADWERGLAALDHRA